MWIKILANKGKTQNFELLCNRASKEQVFRSCKVLHVSEQCFMYKLGLNLMWVVH